MLQQREYTAKEWNEEIMPLVKSGVLKDVSLPKNEFLMYGQVFTGTLQYGEEVFECAGWHSFGKPYVVVKKRN